MRRILRALIALSVLLLTNTVLASPDHGRPRLDAAEGAIHDVGEIAAEVCMSLLDLTGNSYNFYAFVVVPKGTMYCIRVVGIEECGEPK